MSDHITEIIVFTLLFLLVSAMGFVAARWRAPKDMAHLDEWGLGGRSFGGWITWFLVGGDLYTSYTFVAVPALVFGAGAMGFFALPYTVILYPIGLLPLLIAFVVLAVYTYQSGLRAPALIAFVKDILIYVVILVAVFYLPAKLGGWEAIFGAASDKLAQPNPATGRPQGSILLTANNQLQYITLALGSALALFLYPHSLTGILASRGRNVLKRNMMALPAYSLLLGLLALLGYVA